MKPHMHFAIGTAGHIDHGKSTLVAALTGSRALDRLPEEKKRGITIELGFAPWTLAPGVEASVIDVPGHERLVHTMVAGAWGLDLVLLVVAADEGVMPQTREHLAIASLLGVKGAVVALTKMDRVDADLLQLAVEEVGAQVAAAGFPGVPIIPVSAHTGAGLPQLTSTILATLQALPPRTGDTVPFLPVDRVFAVKGFGTVVTGTLGGGSLDVEMVVDVHPGPKGVRVRSLQSHGVDVVQALPGARVAANLHGVAVDQLQRGAVLSTPGALLPTQRVDVLLTVLPEAPPVKDFASVMLHLGAAMVPAKVRCVYAPKDAAPLVEPGQQAVVQLLLEREVVCRPGQHFILRGHQRLPGQGATFGGGTILDPHAPRRRRGRDDTVQAGVVLASGTPQERLVQAVMDAGHHGLDLAMVGRRLPPGNTTKLVEDAVGRGLLKRSRLPDGDVLWHPLRIQAVLERVLVAVETHHLAHPQLGHVGVEEVRSGLKLDGQVMARPRFLALLKLLRHVALVQEDDALRLATHRARTSPAAVLAAVEKAHTSTGWAPPTLKELVDQLGQSRDEVAAALSTLVEQGGLVRVKEDLHFAAGPHGVLVERALAFMDAHDGMTTQEFKDLMGGSRKHVIPFLEHLDDRRITLRVGEKRVRRGRSG